jgi:hypothetical protein|uniref:DUF6017 domain-containing protein n=1 Tax=Enterocloster clostridioformis TaxID=1531 RepID=UPI003521DCC5
MAVCRVEKTKNYTVMANYHLRDKRLSLKAVGLLSKMLSLPEEWDYTTRGLAAICKDGVDAIGAALKELESCGYLVRHRLRDDRGRMRDTEYVIYESPHTALPDTENPYLDNPYLDKPDTENPAQLSKDISDSQKEKNKNGSSIHSIPFPSGEEAPKPETKRKEAKLEEMARYRELIKENIEYDALRCDFPYDHDRLDEIVELLVETVCSGRQYIRVSGEDYPAEVVKSRLLKLNSEHIRFVFDCLKENTTKIRNIRQYLLATLYNAPATIGSYYSALVNHDMYGGSI